MTRNSALKSNGPGFRRDNSIKAPAGAVICVIMPNANSIFIPHLKRSQLGKLYENQLEIRVAECRTR